MELQWELMFFTLFMCLGAGVFAAQGLLVFLEKGKKIQAPALIISLVSVAIGGVASFLHLEHWERIFNGFGHLTSGITQELIGIAVFVVSLVVYFIMLRRSDDEAMPKWCGIMAIVISLLLVVVMAHSYDMPSRPAWNTPLLWLYYLSNAAALGSLVVMLLASIRSEDSVPVMKKVALICIIVAAVVTIVYSLYFVLIADSFTSVEYYIDPTAPANALVNPSNAILSMFVGENALLFWLGVVAIGIIAPVVIIFLARKKAGKTLALYAGIGLACTLAGGICFRVLLYLLGFSVFMFY